MEFHCAPPKNDHLYSVCGARIFTWYRKIWWFLKNTMFLKTCIFWKCFKNVIQVVGFRRWNHYKTSHFSSHAVSPREYWWFWSRKRPLSEKWCFRNVDKWNVQRNHITPWVPSGNHANTIGNVMFSKMVLWLECFYVFELSKQWKFIAFWARRLEIGSGFQLIQGFLYGHKKNGSAECAC